MNLAQKLLFGAGLIGALSLGCNKKGKDITKSTEPEVQRSYINFHAYWSDGSPAFVNVSIYNGDNDQRLLAGSTLSNGNFYSLNTYPIDELYDIYIHDIPTKQCLGDVLVSFQSSTPWPILERMEIKNSVNIGPKDPMRNLEGCKP